MCLENEACQSLAMASLCLVAMCSCFASPALKSCHVCIDWSPLTGVTKGGSVTCQITSLIIAQKLVICFFHPGTFCCISTSQPVLSSEDLTQLLWLCTLHDFIALQKFVSEVTRRSCIFCHRLPLYSPSPPRYGYLQLASALCISNRPFARQDGQVLEKRRAGPAEQSSGYASF